MTAADFIGIVVILVYAGLGWLTGTVRRVIGILIVYAALIAGTNMGQPGGAILEQYNNSIPPQDARLYGWAFFFLLLVIALEAAATAIHGRLQLAVVAFDKAIGVLLGVLTGLVVMAALVYISAGYSRAAINQPSDNQVRVRDSLNGSQFAVPFAKAISGTLVPILGPGLPRDAQAYFTFKSAP